MAKRKIVSTNPDTIEDVIKTPRAKKVKEPIEDTVETVSELIQNTVSTVTNANTVLDFVGSVGINSTGPVTIQNTYATSASTLSAIQTNQIELIEEWNSSRKLDKMVYNHYDEVTNIIEEVLKTFGQGRTTAEQFTVMVNDLETNSETTLEVKVNAYCEMIANSISSLMKLGFKPTLALNEYIKEINDRTGEFDPELGEFVKQPKRKDAYTADYSKAKF